jgi:methylmalonyl-CoA mutase C-terminal domain/subunit
MNKTKRVPRVLIAKIGLDGHNRGAYVIGHGLRNAGMEVIYTGIRQTAASVAMSAVQESVDVIGLSSMVGAHLAIVKKVKKELEVLQAADIPLIIGGIIPEEDYDLLKTLGVSGIFPPGTEVTQIVRHIESLMQKDEWIPEVPGSIAGEDIDSLHLLGTRCDQCGQAYFPSRKNCPECMSDSSIKPIRLSDQGTLQAFAIATVAPAGYTAPHAQAYIDLANEGPRIFTLLVDYGDPANLRLGCEMGLKIVTLGKDKENRTTVGFRFRPQVKEN